jgi:hypothetical protein
MFSFALCSGWLNGQTPDTATIHGQVSGLSYAAVSGAQVELRDTLTSSPGPGFGQPLAGITNQLPARSIPFEGKLHFDAFFAWSSQRKLRRTNTAKR